MISYKCHSMLLTNGSVRTNPSCDISNEYMSLCSISSLVVFILSNALNILYSRKSDLLFWWARTYHFLLNHHITSPKIFGWSLRANHIAFFFIKLFQSSICFSSVNSVGFSWLVSCLVTNVIQTFCEVRAYSMYL